MNLIQRARRRRLDRAARAAWLARGVDAVRAGECEDAKVRAERVMAEYDWAAERVGWLRARLTAEDVRAGPLLTDGWTLAPRMAGIGRRLGGLTAGELEAAQ